MLRRKFHAVSQPFLVAAVTLIFLPGVSLFSQVAPTLDPSRIDQNLKPAPQPKSVPRKELSLNNKQLAPKDAVTLAFTFKELIFEGNVALTSKQLAALWPHKAGDTVTIEDVFALANAITKAYADAGYALCFGVVPEQDIKDGVVKIVVVEGFISGVQVSQLAPRLQVHTSLDAYFRRVQASRPLRADVLERNILLLDDLPGWSAGSVLSASATVIGGSDLQVDFVREPDTLDFSWNNFLPKGLNRDVIGVSYSTCGQLNGTDEITLGYYHSPGCNAYRSLSGSLSTLVGDDGERLSLTFSQSNSRPTDQLLVALSYQGVSRSTRLVLSKPLIRARSSTLLAEVSMGEQDSDSSMTSGPTKLDRIRTLGLALTYDFARLDQSANLVRFGVEQGLSWFGAQGNSRANGSPIFTVATLDFTRTAPIATLGSGALSYSFAAQGQYSFGNPLLSPVESSFGGRQFGRFFDSGSMSGEQSLFGSFELRYTLPMSLGFAEPVRSQFYIFTDAGFTRQQGNLQPQEARGLHAASAGLGVRLSMPHGMNALLEVARPVSIPAGSTGDTSNQLNASFGMRF